MTRHLRTIEQRLREILIEPLQNRGQERAEPLDIWSEIQKHLRAQITLNLAGVPIFPCRHVDIAVAAQESDRQRLQSSLSADELRGAIADFLTEEGCQPPQGFWVSIDFIPLIDDAPALIVRFDNDGGIAVAEKNGATLRVVSGEANLPELKISARRINLGRRERIRDEHGHAIRHNDLAFSEVRNGVNETVSRRHAHLEFDEKSGDYRLFRDSHSAETSVASRGSTRMDVPLGGPGIALKSGDVISLGKAQIEFIY